MEQLETNLLGFLRFFLPALLILWMLCRKGVHKPSREMQKPMWSRALCIAACQICFIYSLQHLTLVESVVLFGAGPLFIPVLERLLFSVPIRMVTVTCLIMTFAGVIVLSGGVGEVALRPELLVGLAAGLFNAGSQLSLYRVSKSSLSALEINFWTFIYASILLCPAMIFTLYYSDLSILMAAESQPAALPLVVAMLGALSLLIINTQVFRAKAYKLASSGSQLAPLIFTNLLFTSLWQWLFFQNTFAATQVIGLSLIVLANVLNIVLPQWPNIKRLWIERQPNTSH